MMKKVIGFLLVLMLVGITTTAAAGREKTTTMMNTDQFTDSIVIIMGKCNTVSSPALWLFGFKFLFNRHIYIQASGGQDEKLTALILPSKIGFYFGQEDMTIQLDGAKGLFFRGDKSWLFQNTPQRIFAVCKASNILVTYV